jgi:DNA-binding transcriptional LysR family regulator
MDKLQSMNAFVAVADAGSFVKAAAAMDMSKSTVSRQVAELEDALGVRLLHRTTRTLSLTDEGQRYAAHCRELLQRLNDAENEISHQHGEPGGTLRVSAPMSLGVLHLAPLWGEFCRRYPQVRLEVTLTDHIVDMVEDGLDVAVRVSQMPNSTLIGRRLASTRLALCASPHYVARCGAPQNPDELAGHSVIGYTLQTVREWEFTGPQGSLLVRPNPIFTANNGDTCRAAALAGQGITLLPTFLVGDDLAAGRLVELMPQFRSLDLGVHVVYPTRKFLPPKVRRLIDYLVEAFAEPRWADPAINGRNGARLPQPMETR